MILVTITPKKRPIKEILSAVEKIDSSVLGDGCEACGYNGLKALLEAAKAVGLKSRLLDYRTSADVSGDEKSVVGYMSAVFW